MFDYLTDQHCNLHVINAENFIFVNVPIAATLFALGGIVFLSIYLFVFRKKHRKIRVQEILNEHMKNKLEQRNLLVSEQDKQYTKKLNEMRAETSRTKTELIKLNEQIDKAKSEARNAQKILDKKKSALEDAGL
jgi:hypothetical protein